MTKEQHLAHLLALMAPLHYHFELLGWSEMQVKERFWLISVMHSRVRLEGVTVSTSGVISSDTSTSFELRPCSATLRTRLSALLAGLLLDGLQARWPQLQAGGQAEGNIDAEDQHEQRPLRRRARRRPRRRLHASCPCGSCSTTT